MSDNLKSKTIGALKWAAADRVAQQGIQFIIGIVLARLLDPKDYGLMGMIIIFAQIAYVMVESGLGSALVRTKDITEKHKNTVFYTNCFISVLLYIVLWFCSPLIADFFNQPSLIWIARVTFLAILFNALYIVPFNMQGRALDYKTITKINFSATLLSGISGIVMAFCDYGVWALVVQQTSYHFFRMISCNIFTRWKPRLMFSFSILKSYAGFSVNMLGTSLLTVIFNNIYTLLLGKLYPVKQVGYYTQGNKMSETINFTFVAILGTVYNLMAQIHDQKERIAQILRTFTKNVGIITIPITVFLIVAGKPLFFLLFGEKWLFAVPYFQIMLLANLFTPLYQIKVHALNARGRSRATFLIELVKRIIILASIGICLWMDWDIMIMLYCYVASCWLAYALSAIVIKKELTLYYKHQLFDIFHGIFSSIVVGIGTYFVAQFIDNLYITFAVQVASACALYAAYQYAFNLKAMNEIKNLLKGKIDEEEAAQ